jgi:collagenase-like PrtC family protease
MNGVAATKSISQSAIRNPRLPELLAPAGDWDCARAAVENGADAIYFGLERFNSRMRAHNFAEAYGISAPARRARLRDVEHAGF